MGTADTMKILRNENADLRAQVEQLQRERDRWQEIATKNFDAKLAITNECNELQAAFVALREHAVEWIAALRSLPETDARRFALGFDAVKRLDDLLADPNPGAKVAAVLMWAKAFFRNGCKYADQERLRMAVRAYGQQESNDAKD